MGPFPTRIVYKNMYTLEGEKEMGTEAPSPLDTKNTSKITLIFSSSIIEEHIKYYITLYL
jgi:hypothetical protein